MKTHFLLLLLFCVTNSIAQNREKTSLPTDYQNFNNLIDTCFAQQKTDCLPIINQTIAKGEKEKVRFLDVFLYKKAYYFMQNNQLDSALKYGKKTIENLNPTEKYRKDLDAYNLVANCFYYQGDLKKAIQNYQKAAKILENGGNQLRLGYLYSNMATLLGESGNTDKQIEYLQKSYQLLKENQDDKFIATVASNLSLGYYFKKDTANVKKWANIALELTQKNEDLVAKSQSYLSLSLMEKDPNKALILAEESMKNAEILQNPINLASSSYRLAEVLNQLGRNQEALQNAEKSVKYATEVGDKITLMKAAGTAAKINYSLGNNTKAAEFYHTYSQLNDSITAVENSQKIHELNIQFETEKKEKQIAEQDLKILQQRSNLLYILLGSALLLSLLGGIYGYSRFQNKIKLNKIQQEKENAILQSFILGEERERNRISHELHDGVAAMIGAAKMGLETVPHLPIEKQNEQITKVKTILENSHADIRHIAHNLLPSVLEKDGLVKATQHFASEINSTQLVHIQVTDQNSNAETLSPQLQLMLFRIIQELVNNTIKHSQAENVEIQFSRILDEFKIDVSDDGIGFDGTINQGNQGLYSISQRMKSIGGNFKFTKKSEKGMLAQIDLKSNT